MYLNFCSAQTDDLSLIYYTCDWEQIIYRSNNTPENVQLMKLVKLSIQLNSRPFFVTGLKYFRVTLVAVLKVTIKEFKFEMGYHIIQYIVFLQIIQGAFSYFTFLTSIR